MTWERCGNLPYYKKTSGRKTYFVNPFNWSEVIVSAEKVGEWAGIAVITYRKVERYDWEALKSGVEKFASPESRNYILRATHEWFSDRIKAQQTAVSNAKVMKLFNDGSEQARDYALEGVSAMIAATLSGDALTLIAIEKDSSAYRDLSDLREFFDYSRQFFIAPSLDEAIGEALDYLGIYEC